MIEVFSSDQDGENKMDQAINRSVAVRSAKYSKEVAQSQTEQEIIPDVTMPEEEKNLEGKVEDV